MAVDRVSQCSFTIAYDSHIDTRGVLTSEGRAGSFPGRDEWDRSYELRESCIL